jgi:DNA-binding NarL/FixJ family response regulator
MPRSRGTRTLRPAPVPLGLRATRMNIGGEDVAVLSFQLPPPTLPASLSAAERIVALGMLQGLSNSAIARARKTSVRTVANQVASLFQKLGVRSRAEAVVALGGPQRP